MLLLNVHFCSTVAIAPNIEETFETINFILFLFFHFLPVEDSILKSVSMSGHQNGYPNRWMWVYVESNNYIGIRTHKAIRILNYFYYFL